MDFIVIITDISLRKIEPEKGMRLTDGNIIAEKEIYLGKGDSLENWHEITEAEYERIEEERKKENELHPDNR
jgi:hypothetical protein